MRHEGQVRQRLARFVIRLALVVVFVLAGLVVYLWGIGLPSWLVEAVLSKVEPSGFVVDAGGICLEPPGWVVLRNARIYRKRVVGPPALHAGSIALLLDPHAGVTRKQWTRRIRIEDADFRPSMLVGASPWISPARLVERHEPVSVVVANCRMEGIVLEELGFEVLQDGPLLVFADVKGTLAGNGYRGTFDGSCAYNINTRRVDGRVRTAFDPHALLPLVRSQSLGGLAELVERFGFTAGLPPDVDVRFTRWLDHNASLSVDGKFQGENMSYNGVEVRETTGRVLVTFHPDGVTVRVNRLLVVRTEGTAEADFDVSSPDGDVRFDGCSKLEPIALVRLIGLSSNLLDGFHFDGPVKISARGRANYRDVKSTDFKAVVESHRIRLAGFTAENCRFGMSMLGPTNTLSGVVAGLCGGTFEGCVTFVVPHSEMTNTYFSVDGALRDADFKQILSALGAVQTGEYRGDFSAELQLEGPWNTDWKKVVQGRGHVSVRKGRVFMLPVFGGLSRILTRVIPGLDFVLRQTDADASFVISDGRVRSDKIKVEGDILSLEGKGTYGLADHSLDFQVQIKLMKEHTLVGMLLRTITYPLSKIFEFRLTGTLENPIWYPINFSPDLLRRIGFLEKERPAEAAKTFDPAAGRPPDTEY
ncbi:MAG: AsmA-like C-terminal region-containing protein [Kiritimatiellae bacterium]|nr:AsmA-like C-terminal region-containing protein [Kiritimatiellia bacterium]